MPPPCFCLRRRERARPSPRAATGRLLETRGSLSFRRIGERRSFPGRRGQSRGQEGRKAARFRRANGKAKSHVVGQIVRLARKERLDYADFLYVCQQARRKLGLRKEGTQAPPALPEADLKRFFRVLQECGDLQHEIMLKLLFYTAVRVSELVRIRVEDVDTQQCKIFINRGKGSKDRYILFPRSFASSSAAT